MPLTPRAQEIIDAGMRAFQRTSIRPQKGHTDVRHMSVYRKGSPLPTGQLHGACVVGAMAFEAKMLHDVAIGSEDEAIVAQYFNVNEFEVRQMEEGFDDYFRYTKTERVAMENGGFESRVKAPFFQVGWAIAKKAIEYYQELDKAETEAWEMHYKRDFSKKDWLDIAMEDNVAELDKYRLWLERRRMTATPDGAA